MSFTQEDYRRQLIRQGYTEKHAAETAARAFRPVQEFKRDSIGRRRPAKPTPAQLDALARARTALANRRAAARASAPKAHAAMLARMAAMTVEERRELTRPAREAAARKRAADRERSRQLAEEAINRHG